MGTKKKVTKKQEVLVSSKIKREITIIGIFVLALLIAASVYTQSVGVLGQYIRGFFVGIFGFASYFVPLYLLTLTGVILFNKFVGKVRWKYIVTGFIILNFAIFAQVISRDGQPLASLLTFEAYYTGASFNNGGLIGGFIGDFLVRLIGYLGTYLLLIALTLIDVILLTEKSFFKLVKFFSSKAGTTIKGQVEKGKQHKESKRQIKEDRKVVVKNHQQSSEDKESEQPINLYENENGQIQIIEASQGEEVSKGNKNVATAKKEKVEKEKKEESVSEEIPIFTASDLPYTFPNMDLLNKMRHHTTSDSRNQLLSNAKRLEQALDSFGVKAKVVQVNKGPTVTRYELQPHQGVKVSKIVNLADDIALHLAASGVRIEAPVPGKGVVGIEVANEDKQPVGLREVLDSSRFKKFPSNVAMGLGKDIDGNVVVADIAKMPHMLIAGATGSGKSVCINTLITSILYKAHPNDVKLILIDPKVVELSVYNGIPHLLIPVVNDPKKAAGALAWAVAEMTDRYKKFAQWNVRDMKGYNKAIEGTDEAHTRMPQIVIIIDELADLMMVSPKDVEEAICRLAQMARAAGINLVIATQRPSVDVITGVIKANIPSRLAFAVSSGIDSRTILDMNGAEKLLGKGDMLFMPIGAQKPIRIQGAFISDKEVENIVNAVKKDADVDYNQHVLEEISSAGGPQVTGGNDGEDEYIEEAIKLVVERQKASISMLQRTFRIGFNRASRLMEQLYERGVVGAEEGSKPRRVLLTQEELGE